MYRFLVLSFIISCLSSSLCYSAIGMRVFECIGKDKLIESKTNEDALGNLAILRIDTKRLDKSGNKLIYSIGSQRIIDPISRKSITIHRSLNIENGKFYFEYKCRNEKDCSEVLSLIQDRAGSFYESIAKDENSFKIYFSKSKKISEEIFENLQDLGSFNKNYLKNNISNKEIDLSNLETHEIMSLFNLDDSYKIERDGFTYYTGGMSSKKINVPGVKKQQVVGFDLVDGYFVGKVVASNEGNIKKIAYYNNGKINYIDKEISSLHDLYVKPPKIDSSDTHLKINIKVNKIKNDKNAKYSTLKSFNNNQSFGGEEAIQMFQIRKSRGAEENSNFSVDMYNELLDIRPNLSFEDLMSDAASARRTTAARSKEVKEMGQRRSGSITWGSAIGVYDSDFVKTEPFVKKSKNKMKKTTYKKGGQEFEALQYIEDGIPTTKYDLINGEWIHPNSNDLTKINIRREKIYKEIMEKTYSSKDELIEDVAKFHWWSTHAMAYKRGSAAISDLSTKYLFMQKGYSPSRWKVGIMPDIEVYTSSLDDFVEKYHSYFE